MIYAPATLDELAVDMEEISRNDIPFFLLGAGSNSLVMDEHWGGAVITFSNLNSLDIEDNKIIAQAGVDNTSLSKVCLNAGLNGMSWMYSLPGQIGSTVRMNARCYGGEISRIVESVTSVCPKGEIKTYSGTEVFLGYKDTIFTKNDEVVAEVTFSLEKGEQRSISEHMNFCQTDRNTKKQFLYPSCGCVFKNNYDIGLPSSLLLDRAGVRQLSSAQVEISPHHANFLYNKGATACEILTTSLEMRELTYERFGVWLEFEMNLLGMVPGDLKERFDDKKVPKVNKEELERLKKEFFTNAL